MRKISRLAILTGLLALSLLAFAQVQLWRAPGLLQYAAPAPFVEQFTDDAGDASDPDAVPTQRPETRMTSGIRALETVFETMGESVSEHSLLGYAHDVDIGDTKQASQKADLFAVTENHFSLFPELIFAGRMPYDEELARGERVVALSQQLAVDLFRVSDPTGREVTLGGQKFRVVGVARRIRQTGDASPYRAYIPLRALASGENSVRPTQLTVSVRPVPGSGAEVQLAPALENWMPGGTLHQLDRDRLAAMLTPRLLLSAFGLYALVVLMKLLFSRCVSHVRETRERLRLEYFRTLLPGLLWRSLLALLMLAALMLICALWARFTLRPILLFPEWVPEVPVEWEEIQKTFWTLSYQASAQTQFRTPESARLEHMTSLANLGSILLLVSACLQWLHSILPTRSGAAQ